MALEIPPESNNAGLASQLLPCVVLGRQGMAMLYKTCCDGVAGYGHVV